MKGLMVVACRAVMITSAQPDVPNRCRFRYCSTSGRDWSAAVSHDYTHVIDATFGLRTIDASYLQTRTGEEYLYAQYWGPGADAPARRPYIAEAAGALTGGALVGAGVGLALGLTGWYLGGGPTDMEGWYSGILASLGAICGVAIGYPLGCGLGTTLAGEALHAEGNTGGAYSGAYLGLLAAVIPIAATDASELYAVGIAALFPPALAVIGYNTGGSDFGARLAPPTMAYRTRRGPDRQMYSAFDCRFVTVRF